MLKNIEYFILFYPNVDKLVSQQIVNLASLTLGRVIGTNVYIQITF